MHNKWGRRYRRHREKHQEYFEALARDAIHRGSVRVDIADGMEVRLRQRRRWLDLADSDGQVFSTTKVSDFRGDDLVRVIAGDIMRWAANFPGVQIPQDPGSQPRTVRAPTEGS